jgi:parafibromin
MSRDPLNSLRRSIASSKPPVPTSSPDSTSAPEAIENLAIATHLQFTEPDRHSFALDTPTRFISSNQPVDLRSIYFAWQKKDVAIPDYIASAQQLNEELSSAHGAGGKVQNLVFVERLDLITWLEGASDESEYIKASDSDVAATQSAQVASGVAGAASAAPNGTSGPRVGKPVDPRLQEIYNGERRMGDRNSVLRGIKPTVCASFLLPFPPDN